MFSSISCRLDEGEQVREGCLGEVKEIEERGRDGVHWRRRNQPKMLTVVRSSGERFCRPGGTICRGMKG
jgi:hypothetical protein